MRKLFIIALMLAVTFTAYAQSDVYAYIVDKTGTPTNVRNAPGGKVVQQLDPDVNYVVNLLSAENNWFCIDPLVEIYGEEKDEELHLKGSTSGYWIHNSLLRFTAVGDPTDCLRSRPSWKSKAIKLSDVTEISFRPIAIKGSWVKVVTSNGRYTGWMHVNRICYNPLTTCP